MRAGQRLRSHFRRRFYEIAKGGNAPIASEALVRIGALYEIEAAIHGRSADDRRAERQTGTRPLIDAMKPWLYDQLRRLPGRSPLAEAIRYGVHRWDGLCRYLDVAGSSSPPCTLAHSSIALFRFRQDARCSFRALLWTHIINSNR